MKELSLHILDIAQNSIVAEATLIQIIITESMREDKLSIKIIDNGCGMDKELLGKVVDPFVTSRKTRRVGLGISLLKAAAERCNGGFEIESEVGKGTTVKVEFQHSHIDRAPLGNMAETMVTLVLANEDIDYIYHHITDKNDFVFDTREIKKALQGVPLSNMEVIHWIKRNIEESLIKMKNHNF